MIWLIGYIVSILLAYAVLRADWNASLPDFKWKVKDRVFYHGV